MKTVTKILVPVDFSETSKTAIRLAFEWSNLLKCDVILLGAYRLIQNREKVEKQTAREIRQSIIQQKEKQLTDLQKEIDFSLAHKVTTTLELGFMPNCIQRIVSEQTIDLIIYGIKPKSIPNTNGDLIRSLQDAHTPFLIVHGNHKAEHFESIKELENDILTKEITDFTKNFDRNLADMDRSPHICFLVHPAESSDLPAQDSTIVERIANFSKTN